MGYVYARRGQVDVEVSFDLDATPVVWAPIGCISGDLVVPRNTSPSSTEPDNWCVSQGGTVQQVDLGAMVIEPTMTVEMDLADPVYPDLNEAFNDREIVGLRITASDTASNTHTLTYGTVITDFTLTFRGAAGATSQFSLTFHVNDIISDAVVQPGS